MTERTGRRLKWRVPCGLSAAAVLALAAAASAGLSGPSSQLSPPATEAACLSVSEAGPVPDPLVALDALRSSHESAFPLMPAGSAEPSRSVAFSRLTSHVSLDNSVPDSSAAASFSLLTSHFSLDKSAPAARELPPPPGSATMVLSGLLTLGACGAVRSLRRANWSAIPDWYHEHAPEQVGHSFVLDLDVITLPVCPFHAPATHRPLACRGGWELNPPLFTSQCLLTLTAPRGPPAMPS